MGEQEDVSNKELEAGLSLLHMMQPPAGSKKRQGGGAASNAAKKPRQGRAAGSILLAAAQRVDPKASEDEEEGEDEDDDCGDADGGFLRRNAQLHTLTHDLNIDELREHFGKPIVEVAKEFGICTTFLKKICRRCGIKRWPHRQIRSLTRTVEMLRHAEANATSVQEKAKYAAQIAHVEAKKRAVIDNPDANGKLERVKKSVLNRSGSPGSKKSGDALRKAAPAQSMEPTVQVDLLHAVAAAAAAASETAVTVTKLTMTATEAEAAAAEALLYSASPRVVVSSIDVSMPAVDLAYSGLPAMTPTASATPESSPSTGPQQGVKISPSHRKLLTLSKGDNDVRVRTSSLGSLQDLEATSKPALEAPADCTPASSTPVVTVDPALSTAMVEAS